MLEMWWVPSAFNWKPSKVMKLSESFCSLHVFGSDLILLRIKTGCFWESICPSLLHQSFICLCKNPAPSPQCLWFSRLRCCLRDVLFGFFLQRGGGGGIHVVAVQMLSLSLRGVSVVALSSRHCRLVGLLACCARQPFFFFQMKTSSAAGGVMQAVGMTKSICCELKVSESVEFVDSPAPFNLYNPESFLHGCTVHFHKNINTSMTGKRLEKNIFWYFLGSSWNGKKIFNYWQEMIFSHWTSSQKHFTAWCWVAYCRLIMCLPCRGQN